MNTAAIKIRISVMSYIDAEEHVGERRALTEQKLVANSQVRDTFRGDWFVEPKMDHSEIGAAKGWICPSATTNALRFCFGYGP